LWPKFFEHKIRFARRNGLFAVRKIIAHLQVKFQNTKTKAPFRMKLNWKNWKTRAVFGVLFLLALAGVYFAFFGEEVTNNCVNVVYAGTPRQTYVACTGTSQEIKDLMEKNRKPPPTSKG
jgi:hypothetical protein